MVLSLPFYPFACIVLKFLTSCQLPDFDKVDNSSIEGINQGIKLWVSD